MLKCSMPMPVNMCIHHTSCNVRDAINCIDIYQFWKLTEFPTEHPIYKFIFIANLFSIFCCFFSICLLNKLFGAIRLRAMRAIANLHLIQFTHGQSVCNFSRSIWHHTHTHTQLFIRRSSHFPFKFHSQNVIYGLIKRYESCLESECHHFLSGCNQLLQLLLLPNIENICKDWAKKTQQR